MQFLHSSNPAALACGLEPLFRKREDLGITTCELVRRRHEVNGAVQPVAVIDESGNGRITGRARTGPRRDACLQCARGTR